MATDTNDKAQTTSRAKLINELKENGETRESLQSKFVLDMKNADSPAFSHPEKE